MKLTDPSCGGQIINFTYPLIGNYGISPASYESSKIHALGVLARSVSKTPSHYTSEEGMGDWLAKMGVPGVCGLDTRAITCKIRKYGTMKCLISTEDLTLSEAEERCKAMVPKYDLMKTAGTSGLIHIAGNGPRVALLDLGIKQSIVNRLANDSCDIYIFPYAAKAKDMLSITPQGILLSNGPGNPEAAAESVAEVRQLLAGEPLPLFGIGLGHQILALAMGGKT